jgi:hypothetical protein
MVIFIQLLLIYYLWDACVGLEYKYNNINILYDNYEEVDKYYNP